MTRSSEKNNADHRVTDVRQGLFSIDEFRYLNVPRVGIFSVHDDLECTMRCLQHPSCISVNLAFEIRLWCELLSSDKYRNPREFNAVGDRDLAKVRIGIVSNNQNDCYSCNSLIGFGTGSYPKGAKSCGNEALHFKLDDGGKSIKAMGYILVQ